MSRIYIYPSFTASTYYELTDCISCTVAESANASYDLDMTYPVNGEHYNDFNTSARIRCKSNDVDEEYFIITEISRPIGGIISVRAVHIAYEAMNAILLPTSQYAKGDSLQDVLSFMGTASGDSAVHYPLSFATDSMTSATVSYAYTSPTPLKSVIFSAAQTYGGIWRFNYTTATLKFARPYKGLRLEYGVNLKECDVNETALQKYTHVLPFWHGKTGNVDSFVFYDNKYVRVYLTDNVANVYVYDCSKLFTSKPTSQQLADEANRFIANPKSNDILGKNTKSITLNYVKLSQTLEHAGAADITIEIGDTVFVRARDGGEFTMIVTGLQYNVLKNRTEQVTLGYENATSAISADPEPVSISETKQNTSVTIAKLMKRVNDMESQIGISTTRPEELVYTENDSGFQPPQGYIPPAGTISYDTVTERYSDHTENTYGFCIKDKGQSTESVEAMFYPDGFYTDLTGF